MSEIAQMWVDWGRRGERVGSCTSEGTLPVRVSVGEFPEQDDQAAQARKSGTERRRALEQLVLDRGYAATSELAAGLGVSEMTIRRDIAKLEQRGRLRNVHGGVTAILDLSLIHI